MSLRGVAKPAALELARLKDHITLRQDDRWSELTQPLHYIEGGREQSVAKGVLDEKRRQQQQFCFGPVFDSVALERANVVAIASLDEQILQDSRIAITRRRAEGALDLAGH